MSGYPIYCINLEHRKDRKEHSLIQFTKLDVLHEKVIYPPFTKDVRGGVYGCFDSHMKVWNDFFTKYPNEKLCLVFEDDFLVSKKTKSIMKKACKFIETNYDDIDILVLHNSRIATDNNKINSDLFTNGYGLNLQAYFITRHYIESIIRKHGKLPEANGTPIDNELINNVDTNNWIYTEKIFYTNKKCVTQLLDKSDNYFNKYDELNRTDVNKQVDDLMKKYSLIKSIRLLNDTQIKQILYYTIKIIQIL
jgi:GR25 family glycosyltransferase involved in LPS biosynthesis